MAPIQMRPAPADRLIIFVKAPQAGQVKTRLAAEIGADAACAAYARLVEELLQRLRKLPRVELRFTPDDTRHRIQAWLAPGWEAQPQGSGDLGARLARAFDEAFAAGAQGVVIIGSDCPEVGAADIHAAWEGLQTSDVVLGPATDGGYWLIGLRTRQPILFADMPWSSSTVLAETLKQARKAGLKIRKLRELSDVDTAADW